jgi:ribulose-5-phosphate 4-epimerase/fuculose-1-phosphate aldolase
VLKARPDIVAAVHTHSPANLAVSAQKGGLRPITQQAMRFYNRIATYPNVVDDTTPEGTAQLARALGDKWTMILENHGALVCGTSLAEAYIYHHFFELACRAQVGALSGGAELITPAPDVCEERARKFGRIGQYDHESRDWVAGMALAGKLFPDHKE